MVERKYCRFKDCLSVATRFDQNIKTFMAMIAIAAFMADLMSADPRNFPPHSWTSAVRIQGEAAYPLSGIF